MVISTIDVFKNAVDVDENSPIDTEDLHAYGYNRYQFVKQADGTYLAKLIGSASGTPCTLAAGDFLWCPMSAERFCTGLTDCDGTSGVYGSLGEGVKLEVIALEEDMLPVEKEWHTIKFINTYDKENPEVVKVSYLEIDQKVVKPEDLFKEGYEFLGWSRDEAATEAEEVVEYPTEDA